MIPAKMFFKLCFYLLELVTVLFSKGCALQEDAQEENLTLIVASAYFLRSGDGCSAR